MCFKIVLITFSPYLLHKFYGCLYKFELISIRIFKIFYKVLILDFIKNQGLNGFFLCIFFLVILLSDYFTDRLVVWILCCWVNVYFNLGA